MPDPSVNTPVDGDGLSTSEVHESARAAAAFLQMDVRIENGWLHADDLDLLRRSIEQRLSSCAPDTEEYTEGRAHLVAIHAAQCAQVDANLARKLAGLSEIRQGLEDLHDLPPDDLLATTPAQICRSLSFGRVMISTVRGSVWTPRHVHVEYARDRDAIEFEEFVSDARIPLAQAPLETQVVRHRTATLVESAEFDRRTFKKIVRAAKSRSYLAAPIVIEGRAAGVLHADRPLDGTELDSDDLTLLEAFAEGLSLTFEIAALTQRWQSQIDWARAASLLDDSTDDAPGPAAVSRRSDSRTAGHTLQPESPLTEREREILEHIATGATNAQIARALYIAEDTVKSHIRRISKKLGTQSRAAAVAAFARQNGSTPLGRA